ncbi:LCCL domain-containing protein [Calothrix sp. 336/3]|uniref:LCCL domain-containing protein n=1 Tax=Calothrix sp. 336/3 TaxID=1337936 RepID=UPI000699B616|nr:LCCL domain-containing protein [Calothrix sp. 336/3]
MRTRIYPTIIFLALSIAILDSAIAQSPGKSPLITMEQIDWATNAGNLRGRLDQDFTFICPSGGAVKTVWGTDIYTDDSSICSAAVHAGLITARNGGKITMRIRPGENFYNGTNRNGVSTQGYGSWQGSFIFLTAQGTPIVTQPQVLLLGWGTSAANLRGRLDQDFTFDCSPNGSIGSVWGTDTYTDDSSICSAAVHRGIINTKNGGRVKIKILPGATSYQGTNRYGVSSQNYGSWQGSFTFLK